MRSLTFVVVLFASGCASTLSTLQTAKPLEPGQFQVSYGVGLFAPVGTIVTVADEGITQSRRIADAIRRDESYTLTDEEKQRLLAAGVALAVAPPGITHELSARAGLVRNLDAGLRYSVNSFRLDAKYRFLRVGETEETAEHRRRAFEMAVGLAGAWHAFKSPVMDVLEVVQVDDFSRFDVEVPIYASADLGDILKLYAAPKYVLSRTSLDQKLVDFSQQGSSVAGLDLGLPSRVDSHFVGATAGFGIGYKYAHLFAELTGGYTFCRPSLFGARRNLGGVTLYPAVGIALKTGAPSGKRAAAR